MEQKSGKEQEEQIDAGGFEEWRMLVLAFICFLQTPVLRVLFSCYSYQPH